MIAILLNIFVFAALALGIFFSYRRGVKKSLIHLALTLVCLIVTLLISAPISRAILNIQIGVSDLGDIITLKNYITSILVNDSSSILSPFFSSVASAVIGPIIFLVLFLILYIIFEIGYALFNKFYLSKQPILQEAKPIKKFGIIVGTVECLMLTLLVFMPMTSLTTTVQNLSTTNITSEDSTTSNVLQENIPEPVLNFIECYNASPLGVLTNWGSLNEPISNTISPVYIGETKVSLTQDIAPLIIDYNKIMDAISTDKVDYSSIREVADGIIDSRVFDALENEFRHITTDKEEFVASLNIDPALRYAVSDTLTNFEVKFAEGDFDFKSYVKENLHIALDELEKGLSVGNIIQFVDYAFANNLDELFKDDMISTLCDTLETVGELPLLKEGFPFIEFFMDMVPSFVTDVINVFYIDSYETAVCTIPYIVNIIEDLNSVKFADTNQTLLQVFVSNDTTFMEKFINSDVASSVLYNMASCQSLRNMVINTFERVDASVGNLLTSFDADFDIGQLLDTISFSDTEDVLSEFMNRVTQQTDDIVAFARNFINDEVDLSDGKILDSLKENIIKFYDLQDGKSQSVFDNVFKNIINYFSGIIVKEDGTPAFSKYREFNEQMVSQFALVPEENQIYGEDSIYLTVNYAEIFKIIKSL